RFQVRVATASGSFLADEPVSVGGLGSGPTPYDLLGAGLGACTAMTCRLYADRKGWPLERVVVEVGHVGKTATSPDQFTRKIGFGGGLDDEQTARLLEIADRCPVHRTLTEGATVTTGVLPDGRPDEGPEDRPEDHLRRMEALCAEAGKEPSA
ncbi:MAG: OsmC family protein, partial [Brevundimonas sp.]|nr:OsmC family protein [Brevundimonas sp.]